jgi:hypothetical protein
VRARDVARAVSLGSPLAPRDAAEQVSQRTSKRGPTKGYVRSPDPWTEQLGEQPTALCATSWCDTATTTTLRSRRSAGPRSATGSTERSTVRPHRRGQRANGAAHCRAGTGAIAPTPSPSWPRAPIGLRHHRPPAASRPATASWSCWFFAHARRNLAPYQCIRRIEIMELPETISGKIRRVDL